MEGESVLNLLKFVFGCFLENRKTRSFNLVFQTALTFVIEICKLKFSLLYAQVESQHS